MKRKLFKKLGAAIFAAALFATGLTVRVQADETVTPFKTEDYKKLMTVDETNPVTAENGSVTITKKISAVYDANGYPTTSFENGSVPVEGVEISITKIGHYATYVDTDGTAHVRIGILKSVANLIGITSTVEKEVDDLWYVYVNSADYNSINESLLDELSDSTDGAKTISDLNTKLKESDISPATIETGVDGTASFTGVDFGIYIVREGSVSDAVIDDNGTKKPVYFSTKQYPYIISLPAYVNSSWETNISANAKNDSEPVTITKKINRDKNSVDASDVGTVDTDVTHVGDRVEFTLKAGIPTLEDPVNREVKIDAFTINDVYSKGITLDETFVNEYVDSTKGNICVIDCNDVDYRLTTETSPTNGDYYIKKNTITGSDLYTDGDSFSVVFTASGLQKLTDIAKNATITDKFVKVNYSAVINDQAVVGTAGNPNKVQLKYAAAGSSEISTVWSDVHEFIFSLEGNKTFDGIENSKNAEEVSFELYLDADCTKPINLTNAGNGKYIYAGEAVGTDPKPTKIQLDEDSRFSIKGVPVTNEVSNASVTLYLKETATAPGYNKLTKVVPIVLTAASANNEYSGLLLGTGTTVNGKQATIIRVDDEGVKVTAAGTGSDSGASFTVNNTTGFQLPSTGGTGIWMFVIGGILVIACGVLYYRRNAGRS